MIDYLSTRSEVFLVFLCPTGCQKCELAITVKRFQFQFYKIKAGQGRKNKFWQKKYCTLNEQIKKYSVLSLRKNSLPSLASARKNRNSDIAQCILSVPIAVFFQAAFILALTVSARPPYFYQVLINTYQTGSAGKIKSKIITKASFIGRKPT